MLTAAAALLVFLLLCKKTEARRSRLLIGVCLFNLALFVGYKLSLSMDAAYVSAYYPNGFNIFNELPLHLCNINLFLIPLGVWKRNRSVMGFSFFVAPLGALMALLFPEPLFSGFSLFLPRILGYYVTHALLVVCGLSLATLGFYRPDPKDIPRILKTFALQTRNIFARFYVLLFTVLKSRPPILRLPAAADRRYPSPAARTRWPPPFCRPRP